MIVVVCFTGNVEKRHISFGVIVLFESFPKYMARMHTCVGVLPWKRWEFLLLSIKTEK